VQAGNRFPLFLALLAIISQCQSKATLSVPLAGLIVPRQSLLPADGFKRKGETMKKILGIISIMILTTSLFAVESHVTELQHVYFVSYFKYYDTSFFILATGLYSVAKKEVFICSFRSSPPALPLIGQPITLACRE